MDNSQDFKIHGDLLEEYTGTDENVVIPDGLKRIGPGAFKNCSFLRSVKLPSSLNEIGYNAFLDCVSLEKITLPDSIKKIEFGTFHNCSSLQSIELPSNLIEIGAFSFKGCTSLADQNGMVIVGNILFDYLGNNTSLTVPDGIVEIGAFAFQENDKLQEIILPKSVICLGNHAFDSCISLEKITLSDNIKAIPSLAFSNCSSLQSIILPSSLKTIENDAFRGCTSLKSVMIPDSTEYIGSEAFMNCSSLQSIELPSSPIKIQKDAFRGCTSLADENGMVILNNILFDYLDNSTSLTVPCGVTEIDSVFNRISSTLIERISVPDTVNVVSSPDIVFWRNNPLKSFILRSSHPQGGEILFGDQIKEAVAATEQLCLRKDSDYPEAVKNGLLNKKDLRKIALQRLSTPEDVPDKTHFEFFMDILKKNRLLLLEEAIYDKDYNTIDKLNALDLLDISAVYKITSKVAEDNTTNDPELTAFALDLTERLFGTEKAQAYVTKKSDQETVLSLKTSDPNSVSELKKLWKYVDNRDGTLSIQSYIGNEKEIQIPSMIGKKKVVSIIIKEPYYSNLFTTNPSPVRITIPEGVSQIGDGAFRLLYDLQSTSIPESVIEIGEEAFGGCFSLKEIHIPNKVKAIKEGTFYKCRSLESVSLPNKVKSIGKKAFYNCSSLKSIELPGSLKEIGDLAFCQCKSLKRIVIPEGVKTIGSSSPAFDTSVTIIGKRGSSAEEYASRFGNPFQEL